MTRFKHGAMLHRRLLLECSWMTYMVFSFFGFSHFGVSVMLPSILLCGIAAWLYSFKMGALTGLLTLPYHMMIMIYHFGDPDRWVDAWEPGGLAAQLLAVAFIAKAKTTRENTTRFNAEITKRIQERTEELQSIVEFMENRAESEYLKISEQLRRVADGQLATLFQHSETLRNFLIYQDASYADTANKLVDIAEDNIEQVRNLHQRLSPGNICKTGIEPAIRKMCAHLSKTTGTQFAITIQDHDRNAPEQTIFTIYRIVHEAVTNALRHGKATRIDIQLDLDAHTFDLMVVNDGAPMQNQESSGIGVQLMHRQARKIGATIQYSTGEAGQTIFKCATARKQQQ